MRLAAGGLRSPGGRRLMIIVAEAASRPDYRLFAPQRRYFRVYDLAVAFYARKVLSPIRCGSVSRKAKAVMHALGRFSAILSLSTLGIFACKAGTQAPTPLTTINAPQGGKIVYGPLSGTT